VPDFFYNPYHFVPIGKERSGDIIKEEFKEFDKEKAAHLTHSRYVSKTTFNGENQDVYSGRIICRIYTEDPVFIGDQRNEQSHKVSNFKLNDKPAIPASTIRGLISSIAEAASNSALRVLKEMHYSYRVGMREGLGALGMIKEEIGENGKISLRLRPLSLPVLKWENNQAEILTRYTKMFTKPLLKAYVNGYVDNGKRIGFLASKNPNSYCADKQEFWYLKLVGKCSLDDNTVTCSETPYIRRRQILGIRATNDDPISQEKYDKLSDIEKCKYTRGILRILDVQGSERDIRNNKKHEIFIPYPTDMESYPTFDAQEAIEKFQNLAKERTEVDKNLPFNLKGSKRNIDIDNNDNIRLRDGDIVFFDVSEDDHEKVSEVSISSIWRRKAGGNSYDYFRKMSPESCEFLPFNPERKVITIAEQLFGFVEQQDKEKQEGALSFASRIKFSFGILSKDEKEPYLLCEVPLKILDSPKPPCSSFYFKPKNITAQASIAKKALNPCKHIPQGRKFYLHRYEGNNASAEPWKTEHEGEHPKQESHVKPLRPKLNFYFHIDFDNLSRKELSLLCYALSPSDDYRHKIGMGKPIGLGKIQMIPEGLFIIDRIKRYSEDIDIFSASRYHKSWFKEGASDKWLEVYEEEKKLAALEHIISPEELRNEFACSMDPDIRKAIELIGDPKSIQYQVHTPQLAGKDKDTEVNTYEWFGENEKRGKQGLKPLNACSTKIEPLDREF